MAELMVFGTTLLIVAIVGLGLAAVTFVLWIFVMPFQLLGMVFKGFGFLLALPFLLLFGLIGCFVFGFGMLVFLFPILPLIAVAYVLWRLLRSPPRPTSA